VSGPSTFSTAAHVLLRDLRVSARIEADRRQRTARLVGVGELIRTACNPRAAL